MRLRLLLCSVLCSCYGFDPENLDLILVETEQEALGSVRVGRDLQLDVAVRAEGTGHAEWVFPENLVVRPDDATAVRIEQVGTVSFYPNGEIDRYGTEPEGAL